MASTSCGCEIFKKGEDHPLAFFGKGPQFSRSQLNVRMVPIYPSLPDFPQPPINRSSTHSLQMDQLEEECALRQTGIEPARLWIRTLALSAFGCPLSL